MRFINKLLLVALAALMVTACENTDLDLQDNPSAVTPDNVDPLL